MREVTCTNGVYPIEAARDVTYLELTNQLIVALVRADATVDADAQRSLATSGVQRHGADQARRAERLVLDERPAPRPVHNAALYDVMSKF